MLHKGNIEDQGTKITNRYISDRSQGHKAGSPVCVQNVSSITNGQHLQLIDEPDNITGYRFKVNLSTTAPMKGFFIMMALNLARQTRKVKAFK